MNWPKLRHIVLVFLLLCLIPATRFHEVDTPLLHLLKNPQQIDPLSLHLSGEFVESNLGTQQNPDGSVTVRMIAEQYMFVPRCILVPAGATVHFRITSADVVHTAAFVSTKYTVEAVPGAITESELRFASPGDYAMPCTEFCGAGHYAMRSELKVVPRAQFPVLQPGERRDCAGHQ
ncbi:MAG TPA: hypothetical protein VMU61_04070 [Candidatus Aquilonibacter sp.]|nr:hypothetical protein [Candidatus Aquilonibacter sp.]